MINKRYKMNPLETNQRVLMWLCGFPPNESSTKIERIAYIIFTLSIISSYSLSVEAGITFIIKTYAINLEETLFSLYHTIGSLIMIYQTVATVIFRRQITGIFEGLSKIYNKCE